jgi:PAS domain S-box-containing protein
VLLGAVLIALALIGTLVGVIAIRSREQSRQTGERRLIGTTAELVGLRRSGELESEQATRELAAIVAGSADAVISWSLDGRVRSWNRSAERMYGYSGEEMLGRRHEVLMPPGEPSDLPELLERVRSGAGIENFETVRMRKDWRRIEVSLTVSPIFDEKRAVVAASTISRDISQQKAAERKLADSARHYELINDLIATCGFDGYFKQLNGAWEQTLGWTPAELLPNPFIELVHPEDQAAVESEVAKLAAGESTAEFKIRIATKEGGWRWTEWSASPDLPSEVFHCAGREVSERMKVERALNAERRQFADAQQIASVGSWELDPKSGERTWSAQQYRNHGFDPAEPLPSFEQVLERIHPDDHELVLAMVAEIEAGRLEFSYTYRVVLPDGDVRAIEADGRPFVDPEGEVRMMGTSRDVTAERDAERLKDDFFGLISHELRTPLTSIIGYTELLAESEAENLSEQGQRFIEVIERNSRRELSLVGDLLLLTKITAGTFKIEHGRADLAELVETAAEHALPEATKAGVEISVEADAAPAIEADPHRLAQVLENLVSNAIKFTPRGGRIAIRAGRQGDAAVLAVTDTGMGIPAEDCDRLFERMFRAREAESRHIQGSGLGLTIVKAIVDAHHGSITVDSDLGKGATFVVELPLVAASPTESGDRQNGAGRARGHSLAIDDE